MRNFLIKQIGLPIIFATVVFGVIAGPTLFDAYTAAIDAGVPMQQFIPLVVEGTKVAFFVVFGNYWPVFYDHVPSVTAAAPELVWQAAELLVPVAVGQVTYVVTLFYIFIRAIFVRRRVMIPVKN